MEVDIFDEIQRLRQAGRKAALATIVQIRGSVPSFQSAKMLIREDGSTMGRSAADALKPKSGRLPRTFCAKKNRGS